MADITPLDAALKEIALEMEALRNRIGNGRMPSSLTVHVEFDKDTGQLRAVDVEEHRRRHIHGSTIPTRPNGTGARREPASTR